LRIPPARNRALHYKEHSVVTFEPEFDKRKREQENHSYRNMRIESGMHIKGVDVEEEEAPARN
jgi:hypothetical protein